MKALAAGCALLLFAGAATADYSGHPSAWLLLKNLESD